MRIISGIYGGRTLISPQDKSIRPTSDKVRGAIFNMIGSRMDLHGAYVLDGFCGSGALGLEALSRGAAQCMFVDKYTALAQQNIEALGAGDNAHIVKSDITRITALTPFNVILLDPPYEQALAEAALAHVTQQDMVADNALIVVEESRYTPLVIPDGLALENEKTYSDTSVYLLKNARL